MTSETLEVRPFCSAAEYEAMIDYFLLAEDALLCGMGVERNRLPPKDEWLREVLADHEVPDDKKDRFYLAWIYNAQQIGHSSINKIRVGEGAYFHLHLWHPHLRKAGLGTEFSRRSVQFYFERFRLKRLFSEPFAENLAPNKVLPRLGFKFIQRYRQCLAPLVVSKRLTATCWLVQKAQATSERRGVSKTGENPR